MKTARIIATILAVVMLLSSSCSKMIRKKKALYVLFLWGYLRGAPSRLYLAVLPQNRILNRDWLLKMDFIKMWVPTVWGEHIEGVRIGDEPTTVVQKLGPPGSKLMVDFAGWMFHYEKPPYNSISIMISNDGALHSGAYSIRVAPPYEETTKEGVRLGMTLEETLKYLPPPDSSLPLSKGRIRDVYYYERVHFLLSMMRKRL